MKYLLLLALISCTTTTTEETNPRPNMCTIDTLDDANVCAQSKVWYCQTDELGNIEWCDLPYRDPYTLEIQ